MQSRELFRWCKDRADNRRRVRELQLRSPWSRKSHSFSYVRFKDHESASSCRDIEAKAVTVVKSECASSGLSLPSWLPNLAHRVTSFASRSFMFPQSEQEQLFVCTGILRSLPAMVIAYQRAAERPHGGPLGTYVLELLSLRLRFSKN